MRISIFLVFILMLNAELALSMTDEGQGAGTSKWKRSVDTNVFDDTKIVTLSLVADSGQTNLGEPVLLVLRCQSNKTEVYIAWNEFLGMEMQPVRTRVGTDEATIMDWSLSSDKQATFYPSSDINFIKSLMNAEKFAAQTTPYNENPITAVFDLTGLKHEVAELRETCGWSEKQERTASARLLELAQKIRESQTEDEMLLLLDEYRADHFLEGVESSTKVEYALNKEGQVKHIVVTVDGEKEGVERLWWSGGKLSAERFYSQGELDGLSREWHRNGQIKRSINYSHGKRQGIERDWFETGQLESEVLYEDDAREGMLRRWRENGKLWFEQCYSAGGQISKRKCK